MSVINGGVSPLHGLWTGVTGLNAFSNAISVTSDNIANINTFGFKGRRLLFADVFADTQAIYNRLGGSKEGEGVRVADTRTDFTQGAFETRDLWSDMAIDGNGFFVVKSNPDAPELYTRAGSFDVGMDENGVNGVLVNPEGLQLQVDQNGAIGSLDTSAAGLKQRFGDDFVLAHNGISVDRNGTVTANSTTGREEVLGKVQIVKFHDPEALLSLGGGVFTQSHDSNIPVQIPQEAIGAKVHGKSLELSNVNLSDQFTNLIEYQRAFQINNRVVSLSDEILQTLVKL